MLDFIRVAAAVPDVAVGNAAENTDRIIEKADEAEKKSPQLTVFPELALTGYTCADLFFQQTLLRSAREGLKKIVSCSEAFSSVIAVGLPLEIHGALYNCAAVIYRGRLYGIVPPPQDPFPQLRGILREAVVYSGIAPRQRFAHLRGTRNRRTSGGKYPRGARSHI